jgi:hypothetical protein
MKTQLTHDRPLVNDDIEQYAYCPCCWKEVSLMDAWFDPYRNVSWEGAQGCQVHFKCLSPRRLKEVQTMYKNNDLGDLPSIGE